MTGLGRADRVAVCSRSFSKNEILRAELQEQHPESTFNDEGLRLTGEALIEYLKGHQGAVVGLEPIDMAVLEAVPELKVVSKYGVGVDNLDLAAMAERGVGVGWTRGVNSRAVAELVVGLTLALLREIVPASAEVRRGEWTQHIGASLQGRTVGIVGLGSIGIEVARLMAAFDVEVIGHDVVASPAAEALGVRRVEVEELLSTSDVITLHIPYRNGERPFLDAEALAGLKSGALVVNTARGGLVDEVALHRELAGGRLGGAALDVFASEPLRESPLFSLPNFIPTPHIGGTTVESTLEMGRAAVRGLGNPRPAAELL